jgi:hypothetical protein
MLLKSHSARSTRGQLPRSGNLHHEDGARLGNPSSADDVRVFDDSAFMPVTQGKQRHQNFAVGLNRGCGTLYAYSSAAATSALKRGCVAIHRNINNEVNYAKAAA